jgi:hypothetical protein
MLYLQPIERKQSLYPEYLYSVVDLLANFTGSDDNKDRINIEQTNLNFS